MVNGSKATVTYYVVAEDTHNVLTPGTITVPGFEDKITNATLTNEDDLGRSSHN